MRHGVRLGYNAALVLLAFSLTGLSGQEAAHARSFSLANGLRVFLLEKPDLPLVNIVTAVNVGSKDETDETSGFVHILEHCVLFAGTRSRSGDEVSRDIRAHGAYFNAHTAQDVSVFEISLPAESADFGLRNQKDILFDFTLGQDKLEQEKAVILEEINQTEDDPARYATSLLLQRLFEGHPYGRPVYGRRDTVKSATVNAVLAFHAKYFVPDNCALSVVGDFSAQDMEEKVRTLFEPLKKSGLSPARLAPAALLKKGVTVKEEKDVKEATLAIGFVAPNFNHPDQYAMHLLTEIMGRGINPLLNSALNSRQDLIKTLGMAYFANLLGGAVVVSLTLDPKNAAYAAQEAVSFLKKAHGLNFSRSDVAGDEQYAVFDYLESAKNRIHFSAEEAEESGLALASSLARFMILNTRENPGRYLDHIAKVDSGDLRKAISNYFSRGESVVVMILPRKPRKGPNSHEASETLFKAGPSPDAALFGGLMPLGSFGRGPGRRRGGGLNARFPMAVSTRNNPAGHRHRLHLSEGQDIADNNHHDLLEGRNVGRPCRQRRAGLSGVPAGARNPGPGQGPRPHGPGHALEGCRPRRLLRHQHRVPV